MRAFLIIPVCLLTLAACAHLPRPIPPPVVRAAQPIAPFDDTPQTFRVPGRHFTPGELTVVRVCIANDLSVVSADVIESSGDRRFDEVALQWARQVRVLTPTAAEPLARCGAVRVEIRLAPEPRTMGGPDVSLG